MRINITGIAVINANHSSEVTTFIRDVYSYYNEVKYSAKQESIIPNVELSLIDSGKFYHEGSVVKDVHGKVAWVSLDINAQKAVVYYERGYIPDSLLFNVIEPVMILLNVLSKSLMVPFHASSFYINNSGVLVMAKSGLGKSTLLLRTILRLKGQFLADEIGWVKDGQLLPYPRKLYIYRRNYLDFPDLYKISSFSLKIKHKIAGLLFFIGALVEMIGFKDVTVFLHKRFMLPVLFSPTDLGKVADRSQQLNKILVILKSPDERQVRELLLDYVIDLWNERAFFNTLLASSFKEEFFRKNTEAIDSFLKSVQVKKIHDIYSSTVNDVLGS